MTGFEWDQKYYSKQQDCFVKSMLTGIFSRAVDMVYLAHDREEAIRLDGKHDPHRTRVPLKKFIMRQLAEQALVGLYDNFHRCRLKCTVRRCNRGTIGITVVPGHCLISIRQYQYLELCDGREPRGLAWLTVILRSLSEVPLRLLIAVSASALFAISTNPKPFDWPENLSMIRLALVTSPYALNAALNSSSVTL